MVYKVKIDLQADPNFKKIPTFKIMSQSIGILWATIHLVLSFTYLDIFYDIGDYENIS